MQTPYEAGLLVALVLQPSKQLRFIRTPPVREARVDVSNLLSAEHWLIRMSWNEAEHLQVSVEAQP